MRWRCGGGGFRACLGMERPTGSLHGETQQKNTHSGRHAGRRPLCGAVLCYEPSPASLARARTIRTAAETRAKYVESTRTPRTANGQRTAETKTRWKTAKLLSELYILDTVEWLKSILFSHRLRMFILVNHTLIRSTYQISFDYRLVRCRSSPTPRRQRIPRFRSASRGVHRTHTSSGSRLDE